MARWTVEDDAALRRMVAGGIRAEQMAGCFGRTTIAVYRRASVLGVKWPIDKERLRKIAAKNAAARAARSKDRAVKARELYATGISVAQVAKKMGLSVGTVENYLRGVTRHAHAEYQEQNEAILSRYLTGMTIDAIADDVGLSPSKVKGRIGPLRTQAVAAQRAAAVAAINKAKVKKTAKAKAARYRAQGQNGPISAAQANAKPKSRPNISRMGQPKQTDTKPVGTYTAAAQFLGRWYRPVFRAAIADRRADPDDYQVGRVRMPALEMLDLARSKGFAA